MLWQKLATHLAFGTEITCCDTTFAENACWVLSYIVKAWCVKSQAKNITRAHILAATTTKGIPHVFEPSVTSYSIKCVVIIFLWKILLIQVISIYWCWQYLWDQDSGRCTIHSKCYYFTGRDGCFLLLIIIIIKGLFVRGSFRTLQKWSGTVSQTGD